MKNDNNPYTRESKSNGRRSSILKRQDSCIPPEETDGNIDCPRTSTKRVSFAKSATVRYMDHLGDESSTACSSSDSSTGSSQSMGHDSMFLPDPVPPTQTRSKDELAENTSLTEEFLSASPVDQPRVLVKAINTLLTDVEVNPSHCSLGSSVSEKKKNNMYTSVNMSISDISQISHCVPWPDSNDEINKRCFSVRQQEAQNHTIFFTDMDEYGISMNITSNISHMSESLLQQRDESFHQGGFFRKVELKNKPGLNRRPSFADEGTSESRDDQVFMEINNSDDDYDDMDSTQNLTKSLSVPYPGKGLSENIVLEPKPKLLDNLFQLLKGREPNDVADFKTEEIISPVAEDLEMGGNSGRQSAADCTIIFNNSCNNEMDSTQNLTKSFSVPYPGKGLDENIVLEPKPKLLDNLFQLLKGQEPNHVADFKTEGITLLGAEDMEITGEFSHVAPRTALSDIPTYKWGLTPVEEMSMITTNSSLIDQENRPPASAVAVLHTGEHISNLNKVCPKIEQMYGVHCNSVSIKPDIEKAIRSPENKENCPILSNVYKPHIERQTSIVPLDLQANNVQFGISSHCFLVKENKSYGNMKIAQATSSCMEQKTRENYEEPHSYVSDNSQMEMTKGMSQTIYVGSMGNANECQVEDFHVSSKISAESKDLHTSQMEMTQCLSRTIFLKMKDSEYPSKVIDVSNTISKTGDITCQMEMTQGLSKTIFLGGIGNECPVKTINDCSQYSEETNKDPNNSQMEMTQCLSKNIYIGDEAIECQNKGINESTHISKINRHPNNSQMEITCGLSRTIYAGDLDIECQSKGVDESAHISKINKHPNNSQMEITCGLSRTIYAGDLDIECRSKGVDESTHISKINKYPNNSQMEMTCGLSRTIYTGDEGNECQSKSFNESNKICQGSTDHNSMHMDMTQGLSRTMFLEGMDSECQSKIHGSRVVQQSLVHEMEAVSNSKISPSQLEIIPKLTLKGCESNIETDTQMINLQKNTATQAVDKKLALQQALIKEIGFQFPLSRTSATFDPFQRRKSSNVDLLFGKGNRGLSRKDQNSFANINNTMPTVSTSGESTSKCLSTLDYTDPNDYTFRAMKQPTFIYDQMGSSSCSEKFDKAGSNEEAWLKIERLQSNTGLPVEFLDSSKVTLSAGAKLNTLTLSYADKYSEDIELSEMLNNQEMPELTEDTIDFKYVEGYSDSEDVSVLSDIEALSKKGRKFINLVDVYESLGISRLEGTLMKKVPVQNVATTTVKEKLIATVIDISRLACLKQHVNEIEATINRSEQDCTERLMQFSNKPPEVLVALQDNEYVPELRTKAQEMIQSCRLSARAKWKQQKTGHLRKYSNELETACQTLQFKVGNVFSDTHKVLDMITNIDQNLQEADMIYGQMQELAIQQKELEETERETQQLKARYLEMDKRLALLTKTNRESAELISVETAKGDTDERFSWIGSFIEWTIVKKTDSEIHFGFLFNTLILEVDLHIGSFHREISRIFLQSKLGGKSRPWAKLAHNLAMSCIDCDKLQSCYKNYDQMHQLLADVSSVVCDSRQLCTELRLAHLKHGLSIDDNRLKVTISNRKTRQKILVDTIVSWNPHPHSPLLWNVKTILGSVLSQDVKSMIDTIEGGPKYITRVLSRIEQILSQHKG